MAASPAHRWLWHLGRCVGVLILAGAVGVVTFLLVFSYASSPAALAWIPALAAIATTSAGLLIDWRGKSRRRRVLDGVLNLVGHEPLAGPLFRGSSLGTQCPKALPLATAVEAEPPNSAFPVWSQGTRD
mgnify:CR=1 FL=1